MSKLKQLHLTSLEAAILYVGLRSIYIEYLNHQHGTGFYSDSSEASDLSPSFQSDFMGVLVALYRSAAGRGSVGIIIPHDYLVLSAAVFAARNCLQEVADGHEAFVPHLDRNIDRLIKRLKKSSKESQAHIRESKGHGHARYLSKAWQHHRTWMRLHLMKDSANARRNK
jgi:hypothetical protein